MQFSRSGGFIAVVLLIVSLARAQIGDVSGEVQIPIVPADRIPPAPALSPEEALKSFTVAPGYKLEIAAADPLVQDPVAMLFGPDGRMWVVEMRGYMPDLDGTGEDAPIGRVVVLRDRDGDGRFDESIVFADGLVMPRAILLVDDGVLIGSPPELAFWRDTDGDGRADKKTVVASDYGVMTDPKRPLLANPERAPNSLLWGFDNWIYSAAYTKKFRYVKGEWQVAVTAFRGQWGLTQDDFGRLYHGSNSDYLRVDVVSYDHLQRNPHYPRPAGANVNAATDQLVWPARVNPGINRGYKQDMLRDGKLKAFTAAGGQWIYRGDLMPELYGNHFVGEPSANLVRRSILTAAEGSVRGRNAYEKAEFIASTDERFRPVNLATGPDGALYIVDLYRGVLQHRISLTTYLRKQSEARGLADPRHLGRIYRVVPADRPAPRVASIAPLSAADWVKRLDHPNAWWRETAQRILVVKRDASVVPALRAMATRGATPHGRVHAIATLAGLGELDRATLAVALDDREAVVRVGAARAGEELLAKPEEREAVARRLQPLLMVPVAEVQLQAALALAALPDAAIMRQIASAVLASRANPFLVDAFHSGLKGREFEVFAQLAAAWPDTDADANRLLAGLARGVWASRSAPEIERLLAFIGGEARSSPARAKAVIDGLAALTTPTRRAVQLTREPAGWSTVADQAALKASFAKLNAAVTWPRKPGPSVAAVEPLTEAQQARAAAGKALFTAVCAPCHQADGRGLDGLAPPLLDSEWVLGSPERLVRIILHGVRGQITVLGRVHMGDMPAFGAFDDEQISGILTFLRREWGHTASPVDPEQIRAIRAATARRSDAWTAVELNQLK